MPKRIQMSRQRPWRAEHPDAVIVARPSKWGNPFKVGERITDPDSVFRNAYINGVSLFRDGIVEDRAHAVALFDFWVMAKVPFTQTDVRLELRGRDLACWCPLTDADGNPVPCHADVLLEVARG